MALLSIIGGESCRFKGVSGERSIKQCFLWIASYLGRGESPFEDEWKTNKKDAGPIGRRDSLKPFRDLRDYRIHSPSSSGLISINLCSSKQDERKAKAKFGIFYWTMCKPVKPYHQQTFYRQVDLASSLTKRTFRLKRRNHVWSLTSLPAHQNRYIYLWTWKTGTTDVNNLVKKKTTKKPIQNSWRYHAVWLLKAHPEKMSSFPLKTFLPPIFLTFYSSPLVSTRQWENES